MSLEHRAQAETASSRGYTLNDVLAPKNLALAWKQVKANKGAAGIDGMEIGDFPAFMREHWETLRSKLENGSYKPSPVRRVEIPKDGGDSPAASACTVPLALSIAYEYEPSLLSVRSPYEPVVAVPSVPPEMVETERVSEASVSLSFARMSPVVVTASSAIESVSADAVGASFVPVIVSVSVAVSVPPLPSDTVYVKVSVMVSPTASAWTVPLALSTAYEYEPSEFSVRSP